MTANARPNLGGLFTGGTPPERSSSIADVLDPSAGGVFTGEGGRGSLDGGSRTAWWDPVNALGHYFDFLQSVFDANRALTMAVATAVTAPLRQERSGR